MAPTLPPRVAERLRELRFNAGPIGADLVLSDRRAETSVAAVMEVEKAIYSEFQVRDVADPDLSSGDWVTAGAMQMVYGVQTAHADRRATSWLRGAELMDLPEDAAVFIAKTPNLWVFLSGSAEYLLDRHVARTDVRSGISDPQAITTMLRSISDYSEPQDSANISEASGDKAVNSVNRLHRRLSHFGLHPLSFLARIISITKWNQDSVALVVGTPLLVEFSRPTF